jgi:hypothetical protein
MWALKFTLCCKQRPFSAHRTGFRISSQPPARKWFGNPFVPLTVKLAKIYRAGPFLFVEHEKSNQISGDNKKDLHAKIPEDMKVVSITEFGVK